MDTPTLADIEIQDYSSEEDNIRKLVEQTKTFLITEPGASLNEFFEDHPNTEGVVITDTNQSPLGLVMRNDYYQKLGSLYGRDLFMQRPVKLVMNARPLIVDVSVDIATISMIAMNRPQNELYDEVIITEDEKLLGVVSIKRFMVELSRNREKEIELLKQQKEILHLANEAEVRHRKQIEDKNNELRERGDSIKNLLDNAGQGFLSFGKDLVISSEYSLECVHIFRGPIGGKNFVEIIRKHLPAELRDMVEEIFNNVFAAPRDLQQKVYLSLLPTELVIYNKIVRVEYKVTQHLDQKRMMLVLTDITEKKELEQRMARERSNLRLVVKALAKQSDVNMTMDEFARFVEQDAAAMVRGNDTAQALAEIFRQMHTFKGDFGQYGLHNTAAQLHEIENHLTELTIRETPPSEEELLEVIAQWSAPSILAEDKSIIVESLGRTYFETEERFLISKERLLTLEKRVEKHLGEQERESVLPMLRSLRRHDVKDLLKAYEDYVMALAGRLEKAIDPIPVKGDEVHIDKDTYQRFIKSLVHVFRNMIDHGIETPEERLEAGKRELGHIKCKVTAKEDGFKITIADDGAGIDVAKVRAKAVEKGTITPERAEDMSDAETFALLFQDSLSTKDEVTALSGRGVGLAAVKAELDALGGRVKVESKKGEGSKFKFYLPLLEA